MVLGPNKVIFVGKVIESGEQGPDGEVISPSTLTVEERLFGLAEGVQEVELQAGWPKAGQVLLVDAFEHSDGKFYLQACNTTLELDKFRDARKNLKYFRRVRDKQLKARFYGEVESAWTMPAIGGAVVSATSANGKRYETASDRKGRFELKALPPGSYSLDISKPGFVERQSYPRRNPVEVVSGECRYERFDMFMDGGISGRLLNAAGSPAQSVVVQVMNAGPDGLPQYVVAEVTSDANGRFGFYGIDPGDYYIGVNIGEFRRDSPYFPTFFPGTPDPGANSLITVEAHEKREVGVLQLPMPLQEHRFNINVQWPDGSPVGEAYVLLEATTGDGRAFEVTFGDWDQDQPIEVRGFQGLKQKVVARIGLTKHQGVPRLGWSSREVEVIGTDEELTLVLQSPTERRAVPAQ